MGRSHFYLPEIGIPMKLTQKQFNQVVDDSPLLKKLTQRRFRRLRGYVDYKIAMRRIAEYYACMTIFAHPSEIISGSDFAAFESCFEMNEDTIFPVYAISKTLTNLFLHTDIPSNLLGIEKPFYQAMLMLPSDNNSLIDEDGDRIDFVHITWFDRESYNSKSRTNKLIEFIANSFGFPVERFEMHGNFEPTERFRIKCVAIVRNKATISHCFGIYEDGAISYFESKSNRTFVEHLSSIVLQFILYLQTFSDHEVQDIAVNRFTETRGSGFAGNIDKVKNYIYVDCKDIIKDNNLGTRGSTSNAYSVSTHWRRGHWRNASVGKNRCNRRIVWIKPTIINPPDLSA